MGNRSVTMRMQCGVEVEPDGTKEVMTDNSGVSPRSFPRQMFGFYFGEVMTVAPSRSDEHELGESELDEWVWGRQGWRCGILLSQLQRLPCLPDSSKSFRTRRSLST